MKYMSVPKKEGQKSPRKSLSIWECVARRRALRRMGRGAQQELNRQDDVAAGNDNWEKDGDSIRLGFQNVNGLGFDENSVKLQRIFNFLKKYEIDKLGILEVNTHWPKIN